MRALDWKDAQEEASHYQRRFHLVKLVKYHKPLQNEHHTGKVAALREERVCKYDLRLICCKLPVYVRRTRYVGTRI